MEKTGKTQRSDYYFFMKINLLLLDYAFELQVNEFNI